MNINQAYYVYMIWKNLTPRCRAPVPSHLGKEGGESVYHKEMVFAQTLECRAGLMGYQETVHER